MPNNVFSQDQQILIQGAPVGINGNIGVTPRSVESFSKCINESIESARNPQNETSFRGFVGAVVQLAKEGMNKVTNE